MFPSRFLSGNSVSRLRCVSGTSVLSGNVSVTFRQAEFLYLSTSQNKARMTIAIYMLMEYEWK